MTLSVIQQHLFSYFNLVKVSSLKSVLEVCGEITDTSGVSMSYTSEELLEELKRINTTIQKYDLEIVEVVDEVSCEKLFVLINTADNFVTQKSKFYGENITQFFSKIVKDCVLSEEGNVSETHCLNLSSDVKMTKSAAQTFLEKLIQEKWLISWNDKISLGVRTLAELEQNIKQNYPDDITNCPFCKLIVIQGYVCPNCKTKCHFACLKKYLIVSKLNCVCPKCKEIWNDVPAHLIPEVSQQSKDEPVLSSGPPKKKKKNFDS